MKEIIVKGRSLDEIRKKWAQEWQCSPDDIEVTVLSRPGLVNKSWSVRLTLNAEGEPKERKGDTRIVWDGAKYLIFPGDEVETIVPFPMAGKVKYKDTELFDEFKIAKEESIDFYPLINNGDFSWEIRAEEDGSRAVAKVRHERPGRFVMDEEVAWKKRWFLERNIFWEQSPWCIRPEVEQLFKNELRKKGIVSGLKQDFWQEILALEGTDEILIAQGSKPVEPIHAILEDFESSSNNDELDADKIDFFASKLEVLEKDDLLAKKIPGREGIPGKDIFGKEIPVQKMKDFKLKVKKNAYLSEDGLEVRAACSGTPKKLANYTYSVEKVHIVNNDVDLNTGSIEFPGDVIISNNVLDGFHVFSSGRVSIKGLVSGARLKAEGGISIGRNVFNSNITVGERHYQRSQFLRQLGEMEQRLLNFIKQLGEIQNSITNPNISFKHLFRTVLERKYFDIPTKARELSSLTQVEDEDFFTREIIAAVHTVKYFVVGVGPFEIKDNTYLLASLREIHNFLMEKGTLVPENVAFIAGYVQNSEIKCSGDFVCRRDIYNSDVRAEGDIKILGVCRMSKLIGGNKITVHELGTSEGGGDTIVKLPSSGQLTAEYCHPNVKIYFGKDYIPIDQTVRKLDVYTENGKLWVDKLKWLDYSK